MRSERGRGEGGGVRSERERGEGGGVRSGGRGELDYNASRGSTPLHFKQQHFEDRRCSVLCEIILKSGRSFCFKPYSHPLQIIGTVVEFSGSLTFRNNVAIETSALHLLSFGQMLFTRGLTVTFEGNVGRCVGVASTQTPPLLLTNHLQQ